MAEKKKDEKKETRSGKRYGHGPKIEPKEGKGDNIKSEAGAPKKASAEAEKTAGKPKPEIEKESDPGPTGTEAAGTGSVPVHDEAMTKRHMKERHDMVKGHHQEMEDMAARHMSAHKAMSARHASEMAQTSEGEGGTEP